MEQESFLTGIILALSATLVINYAIDELEIFALKLLLRIRKSYVNTRLKNYQI